MKTESAQTTSEATVTLLRISTASQAEVIRMVSYGEISMQAAFVTNYIINKSVDRLMGACMAPVSELKEVTGVSSDAVAYKYINEAVSAGLLQAFKASGLATVYRPRYDIILRGSDPRVIGSDFWLEQSRMVRKYESAQIMRTMINCDEDISQNNQDRGGY